MRQMGLGLMKLTVEREKTVIPMSTDVQWGDML